MGWIFSVLFFTILYLVEDLAPEKTAIASLIVIVMFIGSIFFIVIVVYISVRLSSKFSGIVKFFVFSIALLIFSVGGVLAVVYPLAVLSGIKLESKRARNDKDVVISTNNQNTKPLTATPLVPIPLKQKNEPSVLIDCKIHDECGGGTVKTTEIDCINRTCCQVAENKYEFISKEICQQKAKEIKESFYKTVYLPHNGQTLRCLSKAVDYVFEASKILKTKRETYDKMMKSIEGSKGICLETCKKIYLEMNFSDSTYPKCSDNCLQEYLKNIESEKKQLEIFEDYFNDIIQLGDCR